MKTGRVIYGIYQCITFYRNNNNYYFFSIDRYHKKAKKIRCYYMYDTLAVEKYRQPFIDNTFRIYLKRISRAILIHTKTFLIISS